MNKAISLFSGIGGLDIGFAAAGFNIIAQVEIDTFCQRVLKRHASQWWPNAAIFSDVCTFGRKDIAGDIAVIFGGFPCQPHSVAGKKLGAEDDRNLWPQFRRIIGEFRPRAVLLENVPGILSGTGYAVTVIADLAQMGYDCRWGTIQAADTGAPHKRERWFCVAYDNGQRQLQSQGTVGNVRRRVKYSDQGLANHQAEKCTGRRLRIRNAKTLPSNIRTRKVLGNASRTRLARRKGIGRNIRQKCQTAKRDGYTQSGGIIAGKNGIHSTQSRLGRTTHGIPAWLDKPRWPAGQGTYQYDYEAPRTVGKGMPHRSSRIKALGNAVLPQIAYPLACQVMQFLRGNQ